MNLSSRIFVAGHNGLVGSAIIRELKKKKFNRVITATRSKLDLTKQQKVLNFLKKKNQTTLLLQLLK